MKKTKLTRSFLAACSIVALTAFMYGCVHDGGDDGMKTTEPDPGTEMPTTPDPHACDAGPSQACVDARQAELDAINDDATVGELNAAELALTDAQTALADANTATAEETTVSGLVDDAMTAIADIDDESTPAAVAAGRKAIKAAQDSLDGMENLSADTTAALQGRIDALESSFSPNEMAVAMSAATAAAGTKRMAIAAEAEQTDDAGLGGDTARIINAGDEGSYALSIERDRMATTVTVTVNGAAADDSDDVEFMPQDMDLGAGNSMHVRKMDADEDGNVVEEVVIVSTDIEGPKATAFATVYPFDGNPETTGGEDFQSLDIDADNLAMMMTDGITSTGTGTITLLAAVADNENTMDVDETVVAFETAATFDDAPGTLKCGGAADCTATLDADGMITAVSGDWIFTPDAGERVDVADADYLSYGFWLQRTTDADGVLTYNEVETFASSSVAVSGSVGAVTGSATYEEGGATGVYVREVYKAEDGSVDTATSGHFTADARLMATFGQVDEEDCTGANCGTIASNMLNTLTGTIDNFQLSGEEPNDWSVNLDGDIDTGAGTASGTANGGGAAGTYSATFHGPNVDADNDPIQPHTVVGEFNANFGNGTAAGGFGARKQ